MAVNLSPIWGAGAQLLDNSGNVLTGGKIYTYAAGTTTQVATYTSNTGITANSNPIVLNSAGRVPYEIWLTDGQNYKFVLKDSNDVLIGTWDNLSGINSNFVAYTNEQEIQTATAGQTVFNLTTMNYLPGTNNLSVFVDGVNQYGPGAQYAYEETDSNTITFASGLHVGAEVKFTSSQIQNAGAVDALQVSYTYPATNAVTESVEERLAQYVNVKDFGAVGDGVTDDTTAIQNAIDYCLTSTKSLYLEGNFKITTLTIENNAGNAFRLTGRGVLLGASTGSYPALISIKNSSNVTIDGNLSVYGSYNTGYNAGILCYTDNGTNASRLSFYNVNFGAVRRAWQFGRETEPDALISENTVVGGTLYAVPQAAAVIGSQTVTHFIGCELITGDGGVSAFSSIERRIILSIGGSAMITGGELLITDNTSGCVVEMQPIASVAYGNPYGIISITNAAIESASQYGLIHNPDSLSAPTSYASKFIVTQCFGYHAVNGASMVYVGAGYLGNITFTNNNFYCPVSRTLPNVQCVDAGPLVVVDSVSFKEGFIQGLQGLVGGTLKFDRRMIFYANNANGQAFSVGVPTVVKWTGVLTTEDTGRFNAQYSSSTGLFTVPAGGLKSVCVNAVIRTSQSAQSLDISIYLNGSIAAGAPTSSVGGTQRIVAELGDLAAGTTISVVLTQNGASSVSNFGSLENMTIIARN